MLRWRAKAIRGLKVLEEGIANEAQQDQFLQTKTIALSGCGRTKDWVPSMRSEIESFETNQAVQRVTESIPAMRVFTRKAGSGKYKSSLRKRHG